MLKLKNITKSFSGLFSPVLRGINLELLKGDFCVVIGSNGSGKSTMVKVISGEYNVDSGKIWINNQDYTNKSRNTLVSQVVQDVYKGTIPEMTVLENMVLSQNDDNRSLFSFYQHCRDKVRGQVQALAIGLENFLDTKLSNLSGGQKQMIATLMAINANPDVLLLDEHTSALDPKMQRKLLDYTVRSVVERNITTIMITHNLEDAICCGNRLIMLHLGQIVLDVSGKDKSNLTPKELIKLFHHYDDQQMIVRGSR